MQKNQIIILVVIVAVVLIGIIAWSASQMPKSSPEKKAVDTDVEVEEEELAPVFSLSGKISGVDAANNFIMVKPANQEEVKVLIAEATKLVRLEIPFDPANPPADGSFTPTRTDIEISDFKQGDTVFVRAKENIAGKTEFGNVDFIHILP